jgi:hypothetical protein
MARNKLTDLNDHLFEQLERLNDDTLSNDQLQVELMRTKAMKDVSTVIIDNARLSLDAMKMVYKNDPDILPELPEQFGTVLKIGGGKK